MNDIVLGFIGVFISSFCYGSQYLPLKGHDLGDGLFIQWLKVAGSVLCSGVLLIIRGFPPFMPMAALGGLIWSTANAAIVPILGVAGSVGLVLMGNVQMFFGWATARFGWFGLDEPEVSTTRNIVEISGIFLIILSSVFFAMVKRSPPKPAPNETVKRGLAFTVPLEHSLMTTICAGGCVDGFIPPYKPWNSEDSVDSDETDSEMNGRGTAFRRFVVRNRKIIIAAVLAVASAFMLSQGPTPVTFVQQEQQKQNITSTGLDYAFSFSSGAFFGATLYFLVYCILMRNQPKLVPSIALPGLMYGFFWSGGQFGMFFANGKLSQAISFPICMRLPSLVLLAYDVLWFKEIRGRRNLVMLSIACLISIAGVVLIGMADAV